MSTKHTPGPWHIGARYGDLKTEVLSSSHRAIATVWTHAYNPADDKHRSTTAHPQGQANLALIAAAPHIKTALEDLLAAVNNSLVKAEPKVITAMQEAHAAIEEATK